MRIIPKSVLLILIALCFCCVSCVKSTDTLSTDNGKKTETADSVVQKQESAPASTAGDQPALVQTTRLYEGVIKFPPPVWINEANDLSKSEYYRDQKKNVFTLEQIPQGQKFDSWTQLHGVYGFYLPEYDMGKFLKGSVQVLVQACKVKPRIGLMQDQKNKNNYIVTFRCAELKDELVKNGNSAEYGILYLSQVNQSFAKVYQSWRGTPEILEENASVRPMINEAMTRAAKIKYFPAE